MTEQTKATQSVTVSNREGFHLRAATTLIVVARRYNADIAIVKGSLSVDAKSTPLQLLGLGAFEGDKVMLEATGGDAEAAVKALADLFDAHFQVEDDE
jgi:phosphotransferase system HPr (HPr) family protein